MSKKLSKSVSGDRRQLLQAGRRRRGRLARKTPSPLGRARGAAEDDRLPAEVAEHPGIQLRPLRRRPRAQELGDVDIVWTGPTSEERTSRRRSFPA